MRGYLEARTAFFDRVVVNAIGRDVRQIVVLEAGYDGRCVSTPVTICRTE
jgi:O-methyltransferase involved in polyketide biosynthesis